MSKQEHDNLERKTVGGWLSAPFEWRIPVYQRHYAWDSGEEFGPTQLFWEIVEKQTEQRLKKKSVDSHYFGAILVENKSTSLDPTQKYDVVDGQQRLTTINVAMFAIIGVASQSELDCRKIVQDKLAKFIFNDPDGDRKQPKLVPTNFDRTQFGNLCSSAYDASRPKYQDDSEHAKRSKVVQACSFFANEFKEFIETASDQMSAIDALISTITDGFELVLIPLRPTDEAQKVFETLNNTARPLTTFDLIRNNIFYRADKEMHGSDVKLFNSDEWQQFEDTFWEGTPWGRSDKGSHVEAYIARMLMTKKKKILSLKRDAIFKEYKDFAEEEKAKGLGVEAEIETISEYVNIYKYLIGAEHKNPLDTNFKFGYFMLKICKSMDFYPVIFAIANCNVSVEEKQKMIDLLESYVIRRHICQWASESYNKQGPQICGALGNQPNYEKLDEFLKGSQDSQTREFPNNEQITFVCSHNNFHKSKLKQYIFGRIARHTTTARDEVRDIAGLTIDHIMPQGWHEKSGWKKTLEKLIEKGIDVDIKINTIGNLTPMSKGLNSAKSNRDWDVENGAKAHLAKCDLKLTRKLSEKDKWDLDDIDARSKELAGIICEIWRKEIE